METAAWKRGPLNCLQRSYVVVHKTLVLRPPTVGLYGWSVPTGDGRRQVYQFACFHPVEWIIVLLSTGSGSLQFDELLVSVSSCSSGEYFLNIGPRFLSLHCHGSGNANHSIHFLNSSHSCLFLCLSEHPPLQSLSPYSPDTYSLSFPFPFFQASSPLYSPSSFFLEHQLPPCVLW